MPNIGRYEIEREIGRGSMGVVYLAHDPQVRRRVALKTFVIPPGLTHEQESEYRQRFLREAHAAGRLSHPAIVTIFDAGTDPDTGVPFVAMEYVEGRSLREILAALERLPPEEAFALADTLADALTAAHREGIVHRDIKPANILVRERDRAVKIVDFGVARIEASDLTRTGDLFGSPAYMSPEQFRGSAVDARGDLFSLAVILYQALSGRRPFAGHDLSSLAYSVVHTTPPPLDERAQSAPSAVDRFFKKALAKDPADRFRDGVEFREALARVRASRSPASASGWRSWQIGFWRVPPQIAGLASKWMPGGRIPVIEGTLALTLLVLAMLPALWLLWQGFRGPTATAGAGAPAPAQQPQAVPTAGVAQAIAASALGRTHPPAVPASVAPFDGRTRGVAGPTGAPGGPGNRYAGADPAERSGEDGVTSAVAASAQEQTARPPVAKNRAAADGRPARRKKAEAPPVHESPAATDDTAHVEPPAEAAAEPAAAAPAAMPEPSFLLIGVRSHVKDGTLRILIDGREVLARRLSTAEREHEGAADKKKWYKRKEEGFEARLEVTPGRHEVVAHLAREGVDAEHKDRLRVEVAEGESLRIELVAGRRLGPAVSLKLD